VIADLSDAAVAPGQHVVQFYEREECLALAVGGFLGAGLVAGEVALVVATPAHRLRFDAVLLAAGVNVLALRAAGRYVTLDAAELLDSFLVDGMPDPGLFDSSVGALVASFAGTPVRIYGEMVALLWDAGAVAAAIALESLWNDLATRTPFTLFCAYPQRSVAGTSVADICAHHTAVVPEPALPPVLPDAVSRRFEPSPYAGPVARRFVTDTLRAWGRDALVDAAELVVSELVGNAIRHGGSRFRVSVAAVAGGVRIAVTDLSPGLPALRSDDPHGATNGRGMHLVEAVTRCWGTEPHDGGKTVWAEIANVS
jgi:anti-sigma regulatory factor (Ser/Thr protein kinase)